MSIIDPEHPELPARFCELQSSCERGMIQGLLSGRTRASLDLTGHVSSVFDRECWKVGASTARPSKAIA